MVCDHILWSEFSFSLALFVRGTLPIWCYPLVHSRGRSPIRNLGTRVVAVVPQPSVNLSLLLNYWVDGCFRLDHSVKFCMLSDICDCMCLYMCVCLSMHTCAALAINTKLGTNTLRQAVTRHALTRRWRSHGYENYYGHCATGTGVGLHVVWLLRFLVTSQNFTAELSLEFVLSVIGLDI